MTTQVEFHTGVADVTAFACRLLRKACRQGAHVAVTAPAAALRELDRALWTFDERDFIAHRMWPGTSDGPGGDRLTPIWLLALGWQECSTGELPTVLVNLGSEIACDAARFERLIEIVAQDPPSAEAARARWRQYRQTGYAVKHHGPPAD